MEKKEKKQINFNLPAFLFSIMVIFFISAIVAVIVVGITTRDEVVGADGYAVISIDGYTDTIYFTEKYLSRGVYTFYTIDGRKINCHKDNVVIYYDEDSD